MEIKETHIVTSTAGHDKGTYYFVVGERENFVLLADGKNRKLDRPKRKNKKHVRFVCTSDASMAARLHSGAPVENKELRTVLAALRCERRQTQREENTLG